MDTQPTLFGTQNPYGGIGTAVPLAATADPVTSRQSADRAAKSGKVKRNRQIALGPVPLHPEISRFGRKFRRPWVCWPEQRPQGL